MNTKAKGNVSVGAVMSRLMKAGRTVLLPIGDNERYDLVIEEGGKFTRIQVKTGHFHKGAIRVNVCSTNLENGKWIKHGYQGQIDCFGIYCPELDKVYIVPVTKNTVAMTLRLTPAKNKQNACIHQAKDYELGQ